MNWMCCHTGARLVAPLVIRGIWGSTGEKMAGEGRQVVSLIANIVRIREGPNVNKRFDHVADHSALRNDQQSRAGLAGGQVRAEMSDHRTPVMRDQDSSFRCGAIQYLRIADPIQTGLLGRHEVNRGLAPPDGLDDS